MYVHLEGYPQYTQGYGDFEARLTGEFKEQTHTLTLHNATDMDAVDHTWICIPKKKNCHKSLTVPFAELKLHLTTPYYQDMEILIDGEKEIGTSYTTMQGQYIEVTCRTHSDPKAYVEILGVPSTDLQECTRLQEPVWMTGKF